MEAIPRKSLEGGAAVLDEKREVTTYWTDGKLYQRTARRSSLLQQEAKTSEMKEGDVKDFKLAAWSLISMKRMKHYLIVKGTEYAKPKYPIEIDQNIYSEPLRL
jgi:hypothetical protein